MIHRDLNVLGVGRSRDQCGESLAGAKTTSTQDF